MNNVPTYAGAEPKFSRGKGAPILDVARFWKMCKKESGPVEAVPPGSATDKCCMQQPFSMLVMVVTELHYFAAGSLFLSGVSVFFIWFTDTEVAVVAMNCVFNFVVVGAWNCIDIVSTELYPTQLR